MNFFELFDLAPSFDVDLSQLTTRYRELQRQYHPDQLQAQAQTQSNSDQALAQLQQSAKVNEAYDTLRIAAKRAAYLLELKKEAIALEQSIGDIDFLQNALEVREQLDEVDSPEDIESLRNEINQWIQALSNEFRIDYAEEDWAEARDTCRKLAFMQRILNDIDSAEDQFDDLEDF
ncbi:MAG: Fe-S protein assembly co-chaperone HscB [Gammaproteobacteria bacterium]|nr:Fe-S protein assembly co-chaperone HscB [Gammaproteobacteria bacterium]